MADLYSNSGTFNLAGGPGGSSIAAPPYGTGPSCSGSDGVLTIVPEPSSLILLAMAVLSLAYAVRRRGLAAR